MLPRLKIRRITTLALALGLLVGTGFAPIAGATPSLADEEQQGDGLVESIRSGQQRCADLSAADFELIGEHAMGSYLGITTTHEAMNAHMTRMMGPGGERRMHIALGYRYSDCPNGPGSEWVGAMAGMMSGDAGDRGPGMMGRGGYESGDRSGAMMNSRDHDGNSVSALAVLLIALAAAALGGGLVALWNQRRPPRQDIGP
jgi:hypothetical protein